jgi:hypothetical protein
LEATGRKLLIHNIEAQLALRELMCRSLASEYANDNLTADQKEAIVNRWNKTTMERHELRLQLEAQQTQQEAHQQVKALP